MRSWMDGESRSDLNTFAGKYDDNRYLYHKRQLFFLHGSVDSRGEQAWIEEVLVYFHVNEDLLF